MEEIILKTIKSVGMRVRSKEIAEFIINGYNLIKNKVSELKSDTFAYTENLFETVRIASPKRWKCTTSR